QIATIAWDGAPATLVSLRRSLEADWAARVRALELEARTRESEARELSAVLDTATDGVAILDSHCRILSLNRPGEALFGLDQKEIAGENFLTLLSPESREPVKAYFDGLQTSGLASLLNDGREALGRERHGRAIPLFITLGRISSSPDAKFCAVLRDMTQWKTIARDLEEARGQAEKASALKSEFLAKISHEIRTPLNAILGFAEVIVDERFGPIGNDRYKEYVRDIHASGAHMMSLINDLLDLSKIEAGKLDLNFAAVDANQIIQECVSLMQPQAAHERIIVRLSLFDKLPRVIADERSLRQIMLNLMSNAVKFNEPGGQVIVSTAVNDSGQAVIRVRDTGIGMSEAELGAALEPFRQIATTRQTRGTGLGLPLTKALVEANRAGFSIKSRKEQGTLVEVAFPTAQAAAE
ncbi:MAG: ATP-binding protein, partial [Roseiarcus sp.]